MNEAIYLIEKKAISSCSQFRYCIINNSSNQEKYFHHPLTIQKLGILVMSFFKVQSHPSHLNPKEQKKANNQTKPFLACVHNPKINTYLIVGLTPTGTQLMNDDGDRK
jgi:CDC45-like protein